ncbi:MAG: response regulator [Hyphomonadaceae bacterium]
MHDPRKPRPLKPRSLAALIIDPNNFLRGLTAEILRNLNLTDLSLARNLTAAQTYLIDRHFDVILLAWEPDEGSETAGYLAWLKDLRRVPDDRIRRLPVILVTSSLTKQLVIEARDAGVDEFLTRPISPTAMKQRLEMVIQTPRPFVDCSVYVGPCRRRKNPADYHGEKRRAGERRGDRPSRMTDAEVEAAKEPIRVALTALRAACAQLRASDPVSIDNACRDINEARTIAQAQKDHALISSLAAFEAYITMSTPLGQTDANVINTALNALEQLAALPLNYVEARDSVAIALGKAIQKRLAA